MASVYPTPENPATHDDVIRLLQAEYSDRVIAYRPHMARALGGVHEAILMQQLIFWSSKADEDGWFWHTTEQIENETAINRYQQDRAREQLRKIGVIETMRKGIPAKLNYRIMWVALQTSLLTFDKLVCSPSTNWSADGEQTNYKKREDDEKKNTQIENDFDEFYAAYPRKVAKADAWKAWKQVSPDLGVVLMDIQKRIRDRLWVDFKYVPYPASYLRGRRWEDVDLATMIEEPDPPTERELLERQLAFLERGDFTGSDILRYTGTHGEQQRAADITRIRQRLNGDEA